MLRKKPEKKTKIRAATRLPADSLRESKRRDFAPGTRPLLVLLVVLSMATQGVHAEENAPIECDGDQVEYFEKEKKVVGSGDVVITYKEMKLTCDKVTLWTETKNAEAEGHIRLTEGENTFEGEKMSYNLGNSTGEISNFKGYSDPWYTKGEKAERVSEEEFIVKNGYVTTCDHEVPHWKLSANRVEVWPERMVNLYNGLMWANPFSVRNLNIPIFWIPYYCHPLDDDKPHVTLIPGKNKEWGYYLLTAWRYDLMPNQKGNIRLDYREKKDAAVGIEHVYTGTFIGEGNIFGYYMNERDSKWKHQYDRLRYEWNGMYDEQDPGPTEEKEKALLRIRHRWEMTPKTLITAELHKYKDEELLKDYFFNEYEKDEHPISYVLASHYTSFGNMSLLTKKRANRFDEVTEVLPEARIDIYNRRIASSDFYFTGNLRAANINQVYPRHTDDDPGQTADPQHNNVYDSYSRLSYVTKLGFLSVTPYVATGQTYFQREINSKNPQIRGTAYAGVSASTKFFKVFDLKGRPLGIEINRLRHIVTPSMGYNHVAPPTMTPGKVFGGGGVTRSSAMNLSLENKLQTKRGENQDESVDLAMLLISTSYNFDRTPGGEFGNYAAKLELKPFSWLTATSDAAMDPHQRKDHDWLKRINNDVSFNFGEDKGSFGMGHSYQAGSSGLTLSAQLNAIPGWKLKAYHDFDLLAIRHGVKKKRDLKVQEYVITKDLHCWDLDIRYNVDRDQGEELLLVFKLKAFPNIPFEFGRDYHKPKVGSQSYEQQNY